jgi:ribonuclease P protein component
MTGHTFTKAQRLRLAADFEWVYSLKHKTADGVLLVFAARNQLSITRIGLSVSRKHGGAVTRNRLKRLLREAFRLTQNQLPTGLDLIAIPLAKEKASLFAYQESLVKVTRRLLRRLDEAATQGEAVT